MLDAEKRVVDRFYQEFWIYFILTFICLIITIVLLCVVIIKFKKIKIYLKLLICGVTVLFIILDSFLTIVFSKYAKDLNKVRNNDFVYIEGQVVGFSISSSSDDLTVSHSWPIVLIDENNDKVTLSVINSDTKLVLGEYYSFIYLPNTKIAEIVIINNLIKE